jgi:DNA polymerase-3 subunit gamma/tau
MLEQYREQLQPGDVLRMLRLLADDENNIRRTVNPRLAVETMLLRWAIMDRVVDLEQVLAGQGGSAAGGQRHAAAGPAGSGEGSRLSAEVVSGEPAAPPRRPSAPQPPDPAAQPTARLAPSIEAIRAGWPAVVVAARVQSRFLGELVAAVEPAELALPWLNVVMREPNPLFAERLTQEAGKVEEILTRTLGQPVRLRIIDSPAESPAVPKPRRMSDSSLKADRLREFRAKDPALDTAADALDLEIVD